MIAEFNAVDHDIKIAGVGRHDRINGLDFKALIAPFDFDSEDRALYKFAVSKLIEGYQILI